MAVRLRKGETFKCAATKYRRKTYAGSIHPIIFDDMIKKDYPDAFFQDCVEGFLTNKGRFLTREEAKQVAHEQRLLRPGHDKWVDTKLYSEYLVHGTLEHERALT